MDLNKEAAAMEEELSALYHHHMSLYAKQEEQEAADSDDAQSKAYETRIQWAVDAAVKAYPTHISMPEHETMMCRAAFELALLRNEDVFGSLAAFVNDDRNKAWHPEYRPMIEAGRKALEKAGWHP